MAYGRLISMALLAMSLLLAVHALSLTAPNKGHKGRQSALDGPHVSLERAVAVPLQLGMPYTGKAGPDAMVPFELSLAAEDVGDFDSLLATLTWIDIPPLDCNGQLSWQRIYYEYGRPAYGNSSHTQNTEHFLVPTYMLVPPKSSRLPSGSYYFGVYQFNDCNQTLAFTFNVSVSVPIDVSNGRKQNIPFQGGTTVLKTNISTNAHLLTLDVLCPLSPQCGFTFDYSVNGIPSEGFQNGVITNAHSEFTLDQCTPNGAILRGNTQPLQGRSQQISYWFFRWISRSSPSTTSLDYTLSVEHTCLNDCFSVSNGQCDQRTGRCICEDGWYGADCSSRSECLPGTNQTCEDVVNGKGAIFCIGVRGDRTYWTPCSIIECNDGFDLFNSTSCVKDHSKKAKDLSVTNMAAVGVGSLVFGVFVGASIFWCIRRMQAQNDDDYSLMI